MAEYAPLYKPGQAFTRSASATITGGQLVIVSGSGTVAPSSAATHSWVGVAAFDAANGDNVTVFAGGVQRITASGTVTAGNTVEAAASGAVAAHTNGTADVNIVGVALTTATNGNLVEVLLAR
jgi:hypothetical protein